jgi:hypothetical protein
MGTGLSAHRDEDTPPQLTAVQHIAALGARTLHQIERMTARGEDINVVICGPIHVDVPGLCRILQAQTQDVFERCDLPSLLEAGERDDATRHISRSFRRQLEGEILEELSRPVLQMMMDGARPQSRAPHFRIYQGSAMESITASAGASHDLGSIDDAGYAQLRMLGEMAWNWQNRLARPTHTIYAYVHHSDETFLRAYDTYQRTASGGAAALAVSPSQTSAVSSSSSSSSSSESFGATTEASPHVFTLAERKRAHALATKQRMDELFVTGRHDSVAQYFTIVLQHEDLPTPLHATYACYEILSAVEQLQEADVWGAEDAERIAYLSGPHWRGQRVRHIPLQIVAPDSTPASSPLPSGRQRSERSRTLASVDAAVAAEAPTGLKPSSKEILSRDGVYVGPGAGASELLARFREQSPPLPDLPRHERTAEGYVRRPGASANGDVGLTRVTTPIVPRSTRKKASENGSPKPEQHRGLRQVQW